MTTEDREEGRGGLIVDAFIQSVHDDDTGNGGRREGVYDQVFELRNERVACHGRVPLDYTNDLVSKRGEPTCELVGEGREDVLELLPVEVVPRAEKASAEHPCLCNHPGKCLSDG